MVYFRAHSAMDLLSIYEPITEVSVAKLPVGTAPVESTIITSEDDLLTITDCLNKIYVRRRLVNSHDQYDDLYIFYIKSGDKGQYFQLSSNHFQPGDVQYTLTTTSSYYKAKLLSVLE